MTSDYTEVVAALRNLADSLERATPPSEEEAPSTEEEIPLESVRDVLKEISRQGKTPQMKALLHKYGAKRLSEVDPANYKEMLREAEVIRDA